MSKELSSRINGSPSLVQVIHTGRNAGSSTTMIRQKEQRSTQETPLGDEVSELALRSRGYQNYGNWLVRYSDGENRLILGFIPFGRRRIITDVYVPTSRQDREGNTVYRKKQHGE